MDVRTGAHGDDASREAGTLIVAKIALHDHDVWRRCPKRGLAVVRSKPAGSPKSGEGPNATSGLDFTQAGLTEFLFRSHMPFMAISVELWDDADHV